MRGNRARGARAGGGTALVATLCAVATGIAACGTGAATTPVARAGSATTTTVAPVGATGAGTFGVTAQLQYARCMRSHGVPDFPDPGSSGGFLNALSRARSDGTIDPASPTFTAAARSCARYTPLAHLTPAERAAAYQAGLAFSACVRAHGVPNFPDPGPGPGGGDVIDLRPAHIDPNDPALLMANRACAHLIPSGK